MAVRVITLGLLVCLSLAALADTLTGKVVKITDGDTLYVLDANHKQHKIRLAGIDAPERKQPYGLVCRTRLGQQNEPPTLVNSANDVSASELIARRTAGRRAAS